MSTVQPKRTLGPAFRRPLVAPLPPPPTVTGNVADNPSYKSCINMYLVSGIVRVKTLEAESCNSPSDSRKFLRAKLAFKNIKEFHFEFLYCMCREINSNLLINWRGFFVVFYSQKFTALSTKRQKFMLKAVNKQHFYRAMHYSAKRGIEIACRLSERLSVCPSVTLVDQDHRS